MLETPKLNPNDVAVWIFDLDNTLYPATSDLGAQLGQRMGYFVAKFLDLPLDQAKVVQKKYFHTYGTTLRGLMVEKGLHPDEYLDYVHDLDLSDILVDDRLGLALGKLPGRKLIYTNATNEHADRVLRHLEIEHHFEASFDVVDGDFLPKPNSQPYDVMLDRYDIDPKRSVMVEDIAKNLVPASELGMGTVWVRGGRDLELGPEHIDHVHHITDDLPGWLLDLSQN